MSRRTSSEPITMPALMCPVRAKILSGLSLAMWSKIRPPAASEITTINAMTQCSVTRRESYRAIDGSLWQPFSNYMLMKQRT